MKYEMKLVALALSILIISCASAGTYFYWNDVRALRIGMTKQEVIDKLGPPYRTTASKEGDKVKETSVWSYAKVNMLTTNSKSVSIIFLDGKVIEIPPIPEDYKD